MWKCYDESLLMAVDRQYYGKPRDTLLVAEFPTKQEPDASLILIGEIQKGKFMYPRKHPAFFDQPMLLESRP